MKITKQVCCLIFLTVLHLTMSESWDRVRVRMETIQNVSSAHTLSTHILNTSIGRAVPNISVSLYRLNSDKSWQQLNQAVTDEDGRIRELVNANNFETGTYKLHFDTQTYFNAQNLTTFYPFIEIVVECQKGQSYHVPLLLNAFGYSTYRGT